MSNVLSEEKKQQVIALGKLGLSLRQIEQATGVRRETASTYLKAAEIAVAGVGRRSAAKPAIRVATDPDSKMAIEVTTDFIRPFSSKTAIPLPASNVSDSVCEPFRETIELGLSGGRNDYVNSCCLHIRRILQPWMTTAFPIRRKRKIQC